MMSKNGMPPKELRRDHAYMVRMAEAIAVIKMIKKYVVATIVYPLNPILLLS